MSTMKLALLISIILAVFAATAQAQRGDTIVKWPTDFEFVLRSEYAMSRRLCMARDNGSVRWNQAGLHLWDCNYNIEDQSAALVSYGSYGYDLLYRIGHRSDLAPLCVDAPGGHFDYGVQMRLWECNYSAAQQFDATLNKAMYKEGIARYYLQSSSQRQYCLGVARGSPFHNGSPITMQRCDFTHGTLGNVYWSFIGRDGRTYAPFWSERAGLEKVTRAHGRLAATERFGGAAGFSVMAKNETSVVKLSRATGLKITAQNSTHVLWWEKMPEEPKL